MKFSYTLLKKLVPGIKSKDQAIDLLTMHSFETEDAGGNVLDIGLSANRYSDTSSHWGIARELAIPLGVEFENPSQLEELKRGEEISVEIREKELCPRYTACLVEGIEVKDSPGWMQEVLVECGLRPINNIVDTMNYVMLETGQALHAFDMDKLEGERIVVRKAKKGERITTIDMQEFELDGETLVIADAKNPVAIAGIKGGHGPEVSHGTTRILIESASFDPREIYKTSRRIKLETDASVRFSHNLSLALPLIGLKRAVEVVQEILPEAKEVGWHDSLSDPLPKRYVKADAKRIEKLLGTEVKEKDVNNSLMKLGFVSSEEEGVWEIPDLRIDIENEEDIAEEVMRVMGYENLVAVPPHVSVQGAGESDMVVFKEKIRKLLVGFGAHEIYSHSFYSENLCSGEEMELENPVSEEYKFLRSSLVPGISGSMEMSSKFSDSAEVFEIGHVFWKERSEKTYLAVGFGSRDKEVFYLLKGTVQNLLEALGLVDFVFAEDVDRNVDKNLIRVSDGNVMDESRIFLESNGVVFGYLGKMSNAPGEWKTGVVEIDLDALLGLVSGEREYAPISKFPSVMRDVSVLVPVSLKIGTVMQAIQGEDKENIRDVDLVDEYIDPSWNGKQSITLRVVFQSNNRTLTNEEVDAKMEGIEKILRKKFKGEVR